MAELFGMETPSDIRARVGKTGREQDLSLARLPAGRGGVALSSQLGRLFSSGVQGALGIREDQVQAKKMEDVRGTIKNKAMDMGISKEANPIEYLTLTASSLLEAGEVQAASNALSMGTQIKQLTSVPNGTALERNIRTAFNVAPGEPLSGKAREMMKAVLVAKEQSSSVIPSDKQVSGTDVKKSQIDLRSFISPENPIKVGEDTYNSTDDFISTDNRKSFELALARRSRELFNLNKGKGNLALSESEASTQAFTELSPHLTSEFNTVPFTDIEIPGTGNIVFDEKAFRDSLILNKKVKLGDR